MNTNKNTEGGSGDTDVYLMGDLLLFFEPLTFYALLTYRSLVGCYFITSFGVFAVVIFSSEKGQSWRALGMGKEEGNAVTELNGFFMHELPSPASMKE